MWGWSQVHVYASRDELGTAQFITRVVFRFLQYYLTREKQDASARSVLKQAGAVETINN